MTNLSRRNKYQAALRELRREKLHSEKIGRPYKFSLCTILSHGVGDVDKGLKEFHLFKPGNKSYKSHWWDSRDFDVRETCLLLCIEMSKN
jgi:hypothetical protein